MFFSLGLSAQEPVKTEGNEKPAQEESKEYRTSMKGDIPAEYMRSFLATPEQAGAVRKGNLFWYDSLKIGFHSRSRYEGRQNADFNKTTSDYADFIGQTTQVWFLADPSPYFAFKLTLQDARLWGGSQNSGAGGDSRYANTTGAGKVIIPNATSAPTTLRNSTDIREAFIMIKKTEILPVNIQIGRQIFAYGDLKLIGPLNWVYTGFSFDGIRFMYDSKYFSSHLFGTVLSEQHDGPAGLASSNGKSRGSIDDAYFTGSYNTLKPSDLFHIDLYGFGVHKKWIQPASPLTTQDRQRQRDELITGGIRITNRTDKGNLPKGQIFDWTVESAWQKGLTGERVGADWDLLNQTYSGQRVFTEQVKYDARFLSAEAGVHFLEKFRWGVGYTYASGDPNRNDEKVGTWQPLFPQIAGSMPYWNMMNGQSTMVGFQNVKNYSTRLNIKSSFGTFIFALYDIQKAKSQDAWYNVGGAAVSGGSSENRTNNRYQYDANAHLGKRLFYQYDFTYMFTYKEYVSFWAGFSLIQAQDAIRNARQISETATYTFEPASRYYYLMVSALF